MHAFKDLSIPQGNIGVHWFGQNSFALRDDKDTTILIDPYFPRERPSEKFIHRNPPLDESTLPTDAVLITHDHRDHTCIESLQRIHAAFPETRFVGPTESVKRMKENGIPESLLTEVAAGDTVSISAMTTHAVWAKPEQGDPSHGIEPPDVRHLGYVVEAGTVRIYISGDCINTFAEQEGLLQPIAELKPDIGFLTTHPVEGEFPFFNGSVKMAEELGLKAAVPAHYECFVKRTYDPKEWAKLFPTDGPKPVIIPYNSAIVYPG